MKLTLVFAILVSFGTVWCANGNSSGGPGSAAGSAPVSPRATASPSADKKAVVNQNDPRTVREFFLAFTQDVFYIEGCDESSDPGCHKAKAKYLETYLEIEDTKNGYFTAGGDGAQAALKMTIFKKPSGRYIVAVNQFGEIGDDYNFWEYEKGRWRDVSRRVIPDYSTRKMYELPRYGTTVTVYEKKIIDSDGVVEMSERGKKLYDLVWKNGKFTISRK